MLKIDIAQLNLAFVSGSVLFLIMSRIEKGFPKLANPKLKNGKGIADVWELFRKYKFNSYDRRTACLAIELSIMLVGFKDENDSIIHDFKKAKKSLLESNEFKSMPSF